jgi:hypothetical protein
MLTLKLEVTGDDASELFTQLSDLAARAAIAVGEAPAPDTATTAGVPAAIQAEAAARRVAVAGLDHEPDLVANPSGRANEPDDDDEPDEVPPSPAQQAGGPF